MILQSTDELEEYVGNKYSLVILAAKRARQLKEGHLPLSRDTSDNKLSVALREVSEHKLQPIAPPPEEEIAPAPRDMITSLVTGADFDLDEDMDLDEGDAVDDLAALLVGAADDEEEAEAEPVEDTAAEATPAASDDDDDDDAEDADADEDDTEADEEVAGADDEDESDA